jgi:hypothetical protein
MRLAGFGAAEPDSPQSGLSQDRKAAWDVVADLVQLQVEQDGELAKLAEYGSQWVEDSSYEQELLKLLRHSFIASVTADL